MVKKIIAGAFVFILILQLAFAATTEIKIKTLPFQEVQITPCSHISESFVSLGSFVGKSDQYGDVLYTFDATESTFDLIVYVKDELGETIYNKKYTDGFKAGEGVSLEISVNNFKLLPTPGASNVSQEVVVANVTANVTTNESIINSIEVVNLSENKDENSSGGFITGFAVELGNLFTNKIFYYSLGGVVILLAIIFFVIKYIRREKVPKEIKVRKLSDFNSEKEVRLQEARKKLEEAQKEIRNIEGEEKLAAARKKLEEDRKALDDLESQMGGSSS